MAHNLLREKWLPVVLEDGTKVCIAPWEIVGGESLPVDIVPPRADFRAALLEFLVGLMQTVMAPEQKSDWARLLQNPPLPDVLRKAMQTHEPYFNLFGNRPRFMQDLTLSEADKPSQNQVAALLIDSPGGNTLKHGIDFFVKRGRVESLCPACATMALFTLQTFAPSGGKGHRTSMRGGGPLSTLINGKMLWEKVWANVLPLSAEFKTLASAPEGNRLKGKVYPWAAPTRTSENGEETHLEDVHFLHAYWGMPRRIVLEECKAKEPCYLCAAETEVAVETYLTKPSGYNYGPNWIHPLTPYRHQGDQSPLSIKGQANITAYSNWLGIVYGESENNEAAKQNVVRPAMCVDYALAELPESGINAAGYDMDNMKARQWCEHTFPSYALKANQDAFSSEIQNMVQGADRVRKNLAGALKDALVNEAGKNQAKFDKTVFANAGAQFWSRTETKFYELVAQLATLKEFSDIDELLHCWGKYILAEANDLFREKATQCNIPPERMKRYVKAGQKMQNFNRTFLIKTRLLQEGEKR